jgi:hypothetical protein
MFWSFTDSSGIIRFSPPEIRANEEIEHGKASTPYLEFGDRMRIEMLDEAGYTVFGAVDQRVVKVLRLCNPTD